MSIFVSFVSGAALFYLHRYFPFASLFLAVSLFSLYCASLFRNSGGTVRRCHPALMLVVALIIAGLGFFRAWSTYIPAPDYEQLSGQLVDIEGRPLSDAVALQSDRPRFVQDMEIGKAAIGVNPLPISKMRLFTDFPLSPGRSYSASVKIPGDNVFINPAGLAGMDHAPAGYADSIREAGNAERNFLERARGRLNRYFTANFPGDVGSFLMSIITGERGTMSGDLRKAFNVTGLAHILSISGAHFGLLLFIMFKFFKLLIRLLPASVLLRISLRASPSQVAALLCLPIITAYLGISTMEFPAVRSFIMIILFLFGLLIQRKGFWLNTLLFAAAVIVLIQPESLTQLSFQLSFLAVLCLGFYADFEKRRQDKRAIEKRLETAPGTAAGGEKGPDRAPVRAKLRNAAYAAWHYVWGSAAVSLAATAGTAPLVAYAFNYFSLVSPLSNLILTPYIGFVILPASLASSFIYLLTDYFPFRAAIEWATAVCLDLIKYVGSWSYAASPVASFPTILLITFYSAILIYSVWSARVGKRRSSGISKKVVSVAVSLAVIPFTVYAVARATADHGLRATILDVGQGDSSVVELPDSRFMVIDTGKNGFQTASFLRFRGCRKIDILVLTHAHPDHCGGLPLLQKTFQIGEIWDNNMIPYQSGVPASTLHKPVSRGDTFSGAGYSITILHPHKGFYSTLPEGQEDNDYSLVMKIEGKPHSFLFTGDISEDAEEDIAHLESRLKSTVIKVPHHGSRSSIDERFLHYAAPEIAVISAGRKNLFGHPHRETLEAYSGSAVYRTDKDGAVGIDELADGTLRIKTAGGFRIRKADTAYDEYMNIERLFWTW